MKRQRTTLGLASGSKVLSGQGGMYIALVCTENWTVSVAEIRDVDPQLKSRSFGYKNVHLLSCPAVADVSDDQAQESWQQQCSCSIHAAASPRIYTFVRTEAAQYWFTIPGSLNVEDSVSVVSDALHELNP
jgi:hypothetical protein